MKRIAKIEFIEAAMDFRGEIKPCMEATITFDDGVTHLVRCHVDGNKQFNFIEQQYRFLEGIRGSVEFGMDLAEKIAAQQKEPA